MLIVNSYPDPVTSKMCLSLRCPTDLIFHESFPLGNALIKAIPLLREAHVGHYRLVFGSIGSRLGFMLGLQGI